MKKWLKILLIVIGIVGLVAGVIAFLIFGYLISKHNSVVKIENYSSDELLDMFLNNEIPVYNPEDETKYSMLNEIVTGEEEWDSFTIGDRVDLDNDGEKELILNGPYGGMYLDVRDQKVWFLAEGEGTAACLFYAKYNNATWIGHSDTTHGGRLYYWMTKYEGGDNITDEFTLSADYENSDNRSYDENSNFSYRGNKITMEEFEKIREEITGSEEKEKTGDIKETEEKTGDAEKINENTNIKALVKSLENLGSKEDYAKLYELRKACENDWDLEGNWQRTNVHSSFSGDIRITKVNEYGFFFNADLYYYAHSGQIEGQAYFVTDQCAIAEYESYSEEKQYIAFIKDGDEILVVATASSGELGFGMNVFIGGEYTKGEPIYTNANILNETFTDEELEVLQDMIPESYYNDYFIFATTCGSVNATVTGNEKQIEAFVPTMGGYGYKLHIVDEKEYLIEFDDGNTFQSTK